MAGHLRASWKPWAALAWVATLAGALPAAEFRSLGNLFGEDITRITAMSGDASTFVGVGTQYLERVPFSDDGKFFMVLDWIDKPYAWTLSGGAQLPPGGLGDFNDYGVSGVSHDGSTLVGRIGQHRGQAAIYISGEAFIWTPEDGLRGLHSFGNFDAWDSTATAVSGDGQVVVGLASAEGFERQQAFRWTRQGGKQVLSEGFAHPLTGVPVLQSSAADVSADGSVVVGRFQINDYGIQSMFRWTEEQGFEKLDALDGYSGGLASAISADGRTIVGTAEKLWTAGGRSEVFENQAMRWTEETGAISLGSLGERVDTWAEDVSADGSVIVGRFWRPNVDETQGGLGAFIWDEARGMRDLQEVLVKDFGLASSLGGFNQLSVTSISDDGRTLVGTALNPELNSEGFGAVTWLAVLDDPALRADANFDGVVDLADLQILKSHFGRGRFRSEGDFDSDGDVDLADVILLKTEFGSRVAFAVPEPASLLLAGMAFCFLPFYCRNRSR